jgi:hypothetical protein
MPDNNPDQNQNPRDETRDEQQRVPSSNDRHLRTESKETNSPLNREHGDAPRRKSQDTDPDSPEADIDRDDMIDEA